MWDHLEPADLQMIDAPFWDFAAQSIRDLECATRLCRSVDLALGSIFGVSLTGSILGVTL